MYLFFEIEVNVYSSGTHHKKNLVFSPRNLSTFLELKDYQTYLCHINNFSLDGLDVVIEGRKVVIHKNQININFKCKPFKYFDKNPEEIFKGFRENRNYYKCLDYTVTDVGNSS